MSERTPFIVGNWKMFKTIPEARDALTVLRVAVRDVDNVDCGVAPPYTALALSSEILDGSGILVAGQNLYPEDEGAFTGEISAPMLKASGATHVILGHSERRHIFGENDAFVARSRQFLARLRERYPALLPRLCYEEGGLWLAGNHPGKALASYQLALHHFDQLPVAKQRQLGLQKLRREILKALNP